MSSLTGAFPATFYPFPRTAPLAPVVPLSAFSQAGAFPVTFYPVPRPALPAPVVPLSAFSQAGAPSTILPQPSPQALQDEQILGQALQLLGDIRNLPADEAYLRGLGLNLPYRNGAEALRVIQTKGIRVAFGDMGDSPAHAQWIADRNLIMINRRYRGDASKATLYAISEAIYHEAGHAAQMVRVPGAESACNASLVNPDPRAVGDDQSSIQEELNCLGLNTLANRYHQWRDPAYAQSASTSRLVADGVALYTRLFFDADPFKRALINRVVQKYGDLDLASPGHEPPPATQTLAPLAYRVAQQAALSRSLLTVPAGVALAPLAAPSTGFSAFA